MSGHNDDDDVNEEVDDDVNEDVDDVNEEDFSERQQVAILEKISEVGQKKEDDEGHNMGCACCSGGVQNFKALIAESLVEQGFAAIPVNGDPQFAYTIGLSALDLPELIIIGNFGMQTLGELLCMTARYIIDHPEACKSQEVQDVIQVKVHGELVPGVLGCRPMKEEHKHYLGWLKGKFSAVQIIFPDPHGKLPWHDDFNWEWNDRSKQNRLYELDENQK